MHQMAPDDQHANVALHNAATGASVRPRPSAATGPPRMEVFDTRHLRAALDGAGLGGAGRGWAGMGRAGLDWTGLCWTGLDLSGLGWAVLDWDRLGRATTRVVMAEDILLYSHQLYYIRF